MVLDMSNIEWKLYKHKETGELKGAAVVTEENRTVLQRATGISLRLGNLVLRPYFGGGRYSFTWTTPKYLAEKYVALGAPNFEVDTVVDMILSGPEPVAEKPAEPADDFDLLTILRRAGQLADEGRVDEAAIWLSIAGTMVSAAKVVGV